MSDTRTASVLFDAPGPKAIRRYRMITVISVLVLAAILAAALWKLNEQGQFAGSLWSPFLNPAVWENFILEGLIGTLRAAAVGTVLALVFGAVFGLARLSDHWWIRVPAGAVVEFFRAIPLLFLMFFIYFVPPLVSPAIAQSGLGQLQRVLVENVFFIFGVEISSGVITMPAFAAVVLGLTLYNGSVLAEVVRAGILAIPRGQSEAAYAIGMRKNAVMRLILLPQAVTAMMPAIVQQLVVLLKDTALGFIIVYEELLNLSVKKMGANYSNYLQAAIIVAVIYIGINLLLSWFATWLEARNRRSRKLSGPATVPAPGGAGSLHVAGGAAAIGMTDGAGGGESGGPA